VRPSAKTPISTDLQRFLKLLWQPGEVREVRIPKYNTYGHTASGYFDTPEKLAAAIRRWDGRANIYLTLNPVNPALIARATNRIAEKAEKTTADADIVRRRWLMLDIDAKRPSGISSTDQELEAAREVLEAVTSHLNQQGWPAPIKVMSGNGYYSLYPTDLPNDQEALQLVSSALTALSAKFDTEQAHIDTTVSNAARLAGPVGTLKVKGDSTADRPHRRSQLEYVPEQLIPVSPEQLKSVAALAPKPVPAGTRATSRRGLLPLSEILDRYGIEYREQPPDAQGVTWYHVRQCPFHEDGRPFECGVGQKLPDGSFAGKCFHNRGRGKGWQEWKAALGITFRHNGDRPDIPQSNDGLPRILVTNRHLHETASDAWDAILNTNDPPWLFRHAGQISEIGRDDEGRPIVSHLSLPALRGRLDRAAEWMRLSKRGELLPARPPKDVTEDMMALDKPLPILRGIVGTPVFSTDGTLVMVPGYQESTRLHYEATGKPVPKVPERPSDADLESAKRLLLTEWLFDFPFADDSSRAHAIAAPLTAITREMVDGPTPLFAVDAPSPGTGKGLLAEGIGVVVAGAPLAVMTVGRGEEEMRKRTTAILRDGSPVILLDNVKRRLDSAALAAVLTTTVWADRVLGKSETIRLPNRSLWLATGNNLDLDGEMVRRVVWVRLDPKVDRPWERTGFRHDPLTPWVRGHRHELVWALLVLVQHWIAQGQPSWDGPPLGSFEAWCRVVGGVLAAAGIPGFLSNREELYRRADAETEEWRAFVAAWWETHGDAPVKAGQLFELTHQWELLPSVFATAKDDATERALRTRLGKALSQRRDRRYGDFFVRTLGQDLHQKGTLYRLEDADSTDNEAPSSASSANLPQDKASSPNTIAEDAEHAERVFNAKSEKSEDQQEEVRIAKNVPHPPHVPQTDTDSADLGAEGMRKVPPNVPHNVPQQGSPRCRKCGLPMNVARVSDICGRCQRDG